MSVRVFECVLCLFQLLRACNVAMYAHTHIHTHTHTQSDLTEASVGPCAQGTMCSVVLANKTQSALPPVCVHNLCVQMCSNL